MSRVGIGWRRRRRRELRAREAATRSAIPAVWKTVDDATVKHPTRVGRAVVTGVEMAAAGLLVAKIQVEFIALRAVLPTGERIYEFQRAGRSFSLRVDAKDGIERSVVWVVALTECERLNLDLPDGAEPVPGATFELKAPPVVRAQPTAITYTYSWADDLTAE